MAEADSYIKSQGVFSEFSPPIPENQINPSKFYSHFLLKTLFVVVFIVLLPFFPSQAPEYLNQTLLNRSWELLQLLFVGIAVSYGLFSRRNVEAEKENQSKIDTTQTYLSRILQVSSVFDDEVESPSGSDENKIQTWNSQYFRGQSEVIVSQENSVLDEQGNTSMDISNKPLLLPVRSLRSQVSEEDANESVKEHGRLLGSLSRSGSLTRSGSSLKGSSNGSIRTRNGESGSLDHLDLEEKLKENVVLPSPIPWRSRSGRMEMNEEVGAVTPPLYTLPPSVEESEFDRLNSRSFSSPVSRNSRPNSASPSPEKLSPSPSLSPELRAKNVEDMGRKKNFNKSSSIPAAPPPPPIDRKYSSMKTNFSPISNGFSSEKKEVKRSLDELNDLSRSKREDAPSRRNSGQDTLKPETKPSNSEGSSIGKSVRTVKASEPVVEVRRARDFTRERMEEKTGKRPKEIESVMVEKTGRKMGGFDQPLMATERNSFESPRPTPTPKFPNNPQEEKKEFTENDIVVSEEDSDSEPDDIEGISGNEEVASNTVCDSEADPNEVDKKADEFIAKFREQIRLQRIASIKRSSGKHTTKNSSN